MLCLSLNWRWARGTKPCTYYLLVVRSFICDTIMPLTLNLNISFSRLLNKTRKRFGLSDVRRRGMYSHVQL